MHKGRSLLALALASLLLALGLIGASPPLAAGAPEAAGTADCAAFNTPIYQVVKPKNDASLVTPTKWEAEKAAGYGFVSYQGVVFTAARRPGPGLVAVHRLYRWFGQDFMASADPEEIAAAQGGVGYEDQGINFYAATEASDCLVPVYSFTKSGKHRLSVTAESKKALLADGWESQGVVYYAAPGEAPEPGPKPTPTPSGTPTATPTPSETPTATPTPSETPTAAPPGDPAPSETTPTDDDPTFTLAAMPDTQQEVGTDTRFIHRTRWLVSQEEALDLRFVTHSGDLVNWDTPDHEQYEVASAAMRPLETASIPYTIAIGNHDTMATGPGGGARDTTMTRIYQRDTRTFNSYFNVGRYTKVAGAFEPNKVDNIYSLYEAGGVKWMVLVLELWPRQAVVEWAKQAVASHPQHNVVVVTHDYINGAGDLGQYSSYGDTSPQYLFDNLISQYPNVRMTFSGHVGWAGDKVFTGKNGNKIYSFLTTIHSNTTNPVRLVSVDTEAGTLKTWIYAPWTNGTFTTYSKTFTGVDFVR